MPAEMSSRQRVMTAARLQVPDRVPRTVPLEIGVYEKLKAHLGTAEVARAFKVDLGWVGPDPSRQAPDYSVYFRRPGVTWDEWGRGRIWDAEMHYAEYLYPLERAETVDEILAYPWPDLTEPYRYDGVAERVAAYHAQGLAVCGGLEETVFEIAWQLRGMDRLFADMISQDEKAAIVLDQITDRRAVTARAYALAGVDILDVGDDVGMQDRLLMSRRMWTQWLRPRLEKVIQAARDVNPDILVWYHSDGKISDLVPDLMAAGVQILNPVQPECVDHRWIKRTYGSELAFAGGLGVQSVLPFGSPEQVREHVRETIQTLGEGGGLIVGPSHVMERDTPLENIFAMLKAIDDFGVYG